MFGVLHLPNSAATRTRLCPETAQTISLNTRKRGSLSAFVSSLIKIVAQITEFEMPTTFLVHLEVKSNILGVSC